MDNHSKLVSKFSIVGMVLALFVVGLGCKVFTASEAPVFNEILTRPTSDDADSLVVETITTPEEFQLVEINTDEEQLLINLYEKVNPAVVNITALENLDGELVGYSQGSGFLYDLAGDIVTNAHVIYGAEALDVTFPSGLTVPAKVIGQDFSSDLAVIQVVEFPPVVTPLPLGDDENVKAGQTVVAIGNPFGFSGTMTRGIVSAIGRTIPALNTFRIPKAIQTDAPINPGNSGGPLLNLNGEVIGINAQIRTDGEDRSNSGVGFAIPVSLVKRVVPALIEDGRYTWPWLGVSGGDLDWITAQAMGLPFNQGAYLSTIIEGGPTDKAGLRGTTSTKTYQNRTVEIGGDIITAINGVPVRSFDDLLIYIALETSPGDEVTLTVYRDGQEKQFQVILEPRPDELLQPFLP
jgi:2-alkenal reductase